MEQITGIEVNGYIYRYPGVTYQTDCGVLLSFQNDSHKWDGIYPGMSWDQFYNNLARMNIELITPKVAQKRMMHPLFMWPFKPVGTCQRTHCVQDTSSKYCSIHCWYFDTIEMIKYAIKNATSLDIIDSNVRYMERLMTEFGPLVQFGCDADCTS